jgi:tellurite resistance protein
VRSLVAVAWVDGKLESGESSVIEGLLTGFDASEAEEREILEYAKARRTLENDIPLAELNRGDRELLLSNAALLTHADGDQSAKEKAVLKKLAGILGFSHDEANAILASASDGALRLSEHALAPDE